MERKDLIAKIQALMQMTVERGATPSEAQIAARKINELLLKYNLDLAEVKPITADEEMGWDIPHDKYAKGKSVWHLNLPMPEWMHTLAVSIGRLNFCEVIGNENAIYLGLKKDSELAAYMFETLMHQLRQQAIIAHRDWVREKWGGKQPRDTMVDTKTTALVVNKQAKAREYAQTKYPVWYGLKEPAPSRKPSKDRTDKDDPRRYNYFSGEAWGRGHEAGKNISVRPGITGQDRKKID